MTEPVVDAEALKKAEEYIEEEEGASNKLRGWLGVFVTATAVTMSVFHLYTAYAIVPTQTLRPVHVGFVLFLTYLLFPVAKRYRHRIMWWDWVAALASVAIIAYILNGGDDFWDRNTSPNNWDIVFGAALIVLILEGMRRASGWVMPAVVIAFILYAFFGEYLPGSWAHRSYETRSEEHTSELQSLRHLVCRLLLEKKQHTSSLQSLRHRVCRHLIEKKKDTHHDLTNDNQSLEHHDYSSTSAASP